MSDQIAIKVENVSKTFKLPHEKVSTVKSAAINFYKRKRTFEKQKVLDNISFEIKKGEFFGIVGRNGSGKSTLLKLLAGIYSPDSGQIQINGKLTPFIELGVGFSPELTGRENVFLNGALLGFSRREIEKMYDDIVEFAELERFMDQKLKNYSSGMQVRLAFSIAVQSKNEILLLDEVLAVGDLNFQKKCFNYFRELKREKRTVIFISHDMNAVKEYCDNAMLVVDGCISDKGSPDMISKKYMEKNRSADKNKEYTNNNNNTNKSKSKIHLLRASAKIKAKTIDIHTAYKSKMEINNPIFGITINGPTGLKVFEANTKWKGLEVGEVHNNTEINICWSVPNIFTNGENKVTLAVADEYGSSIIDWEEEAVTFLLEEDIITTAVVAPKYEVSLDVK